MNVDIAKAVKTINTAAEEIGLIANAAQDKVDAAPNETEAQLERAELLQERADTIARMLYDLHDMAQELEGTP